MSLQTNFFSFVLFSSYLVIFFFHARTHPTATGKFMYLCGELDGLVGVVGDGVGAGLEGRDEGPGRVEPEEVEVVLEHTVHEQGVLPLANRLVHEQLGLLRDVQLLRLKNQGTLQPRQTD